ncbi:MAG: HAD family hydrolase [Promethearchaeota archaeon]
MEEEKSLADYGFIFDLDGTLLDDIELARKLPYLALEEMGYDINHPHDPNLERKILNILGENGTNFIIFRIFMKIAKFFGVPWYHRLKFIKKCNIVYKREITNCPLFPGAVKAVQEIIKRRGQVGILTTSSMLEIKDRFQNRENLLDPFENNILGRDMVKKMKPNPAGIIHLAKKWNIPLKNIVMIGDMKNDIQAGKAVGCTTIGVLSGFSSREELEKEQADFILPDVSHLISILPQIITQISNKK